MHEVAECTGQVFAKRWQEHELQTLVKEVVVVEEDEFIWNPKRARRILLQVMIEQRVDNVIQHIIVATRRFVQFSLSHSHARSLSSALSLSPFSPPLRLFLCLRENSYARTLSFHTRKHVGPTSSKIDSRFQRFQTPPPAPQSPKSIYRAGVHSSQQAPGMETYTRSPHV